MLDLAIIIKVLQEVLIDKGMKVSGLALDAPEDRVKLFMILLNELIKEANKDEV